MVVRGVRGATTIEHNVELDILSATSELLLEIMEVNQFQPTDICSVMITVTHDITAAFPAKAIRQLSGWDMVPLMCALEIPVAQSLAKCIRVMMHINTTKKQEEIKHVYLRQAVSLRPDLTNLTNPQ